MADPRHVLGQFYLQLDGGEAPTELVRDVLEVTVDSSLHLPDSATLVLHDTRLQWIDDARLEPGKTLRIQTRVGQRTETVFDGELVELEPEFGSSTQRLTIRAFDRLHRLGRGRHVRSFVNTTDGDIVRRLAQEVGLRAEVGATPQVHSYVLQANETNLDFLTARAASLGYLLFVEGETLHFERPRPGASDAELQWGETLVEFRPRWTSVAQVSGTTVRGWDPDTRQAIVGHVDRGEGHPEVGERRSGGAVAEAAFNLPAAELITDRPVRDQRSADRLAQAVADRRASGYIEAEGACSGTPALVAGASVRITAVGRRFEGTYFITSATHTFTAAEGYQTRFTVSGQQRCGLIALLAPETRALPTTGLVVGVVTDNQDPDGQGRVKVKYPWLSNDHASDWARVVSPGGGNTRGIQFLPEVNDEVLVGFEMGDVHFPYVLGGLWNRQDPPPVRSAEAASSAGVQRRVIRSRAGHRITIDDTAGGGGITVEDSNGNKLALDSGSNGMLLQARGTIKIEAQGQVQIRGLGVTIEGGAGTVDVTGSLVNLN